jgi:hypothetical protein
MTTHINDAGTWRQLQGVYVNDAGTWRDIQEVHVNDAGTWRLVYQNLSVQLQVPTGWQAGGGTASFTFNSNGNLYATQGTPGAEVLQYAWLLGGSASAVDVRIDMTGGSMSFGTTGAWLNLATSRGFQLFWPGGISTSSCAFTMSLRNASTGVVLATQASSLATHP